MLEMSGADAYFLWEESRARHMHTLKVIIVDTSDAHEQVTFERVRDGGLLVLPHLPAFRRRSVPAPLGIGHPHWVDAPELDAEYHFRHEVLPSGGGDEALDELLGRIVSEPLDPDRPRWQIFFVEGLPGGRIAYVTKLHHSLADGPASAELVLRTFQGDASPTPLGPGYTGTNEPVPPPGRRLLRALRREISRTRELPGLALRSLRALGVTLRWRRSGRSLPPRPFATPGTPFNRPLTPNRVCARATLPLAELREIKTALGCTLNDVYMALVGGALRKYLAARGGSGAPELTAAVPVSVRGEGDDPSFGNATAYWFATTGSQIADPVERALRVSRSTRTAREHFEARDPRLPVEWLEHGPLRRLYLSGIATVAGALSRRPTYNVIVSNVRGPGEPLFIDGSRVESLCSIGPLALHQGLNFTAWSYGNDFAVGVHACREHVPDIPMLADALHDEFDALRRAVGERKKRSALPVRRVEAAA